jgi:hypothetical protein
MPAKLWLSWERVRNNEEKQPPHPSPYVPMRAIKAYLNVEGVGVLKIHMCIIIHGLHFFYLNQTVAGSNR